MLSGLFVLLLSFSAFAGPDGHIVAVFKHFDEVNNSHPTVLCGNGVWGNTSACDAPLDITRALEDLGVPDQVQKFLLCLQRRESTCGQPERAGSNAGPFQMNAGDYAQCKKGIEKLKNSGYENQNYSIVRTWNEHSCARLSETNHLCATYCAYFHVAFHRGETKDFTKPSQWVVTSTCLREQGLPHNYFSDGRFTNFEE